MARSAVKKVVTKKVVVPKVKKAVAKKVVAPKKSVTPK